ncbi:MAG TPA: AMP-binding protein, partial [Burkholderiales bacterium]|nr:AMP-binding protein [Burkholderiales bacterium]
PDERWFRTADRVEIADAGRFFLRGRVDRIAKVEGKRVSLNAIERQLIASRWVAEARVAVLEGKRQRLAAFVVLTPDGQRELADGGKPRLNHLLAQILSAHVEPVAMPRLWRYLDALPVNSQGKTTLADLTATTTPLAARKIWPRERLVEQSAERALFELVAPADLIYFDGHFRGAPLLAGVVQIDWVVAYGRRCFDLPAAFRGVHALKFHRLIKPEMGFTLELIFERAKSALAFKIASAAGTHASGRILFGAASV